MACLQVLHGPKTGSQRTAPYDSSECMAYIVQVGILRKQTGNPRYKSMERSRLRY
ncbi:hypothetical protein M404DRAFT_327242 [Pisolithus tinctorius Marx 270]|uniref:Uncharacterized protein n=1 Tax=Pisolithus tinctorius Marx 270 TaxID=870435 RepID=A0A0C3KGU2_PISTI|nr:hypothetical protein M404DRAFT_327242 [Pisolithus tinctorius Marx 270]